MKRQCYIVLMLMLMIVIPALVGCAHSGSAPDNHGQAMVSVKVKVLK